MSVAVVGLGNLILSDEAELHPVTWGSPSSHRLLRSSYVNY